MKPRIKILRKWDDGVYYKCSDKKVEAYGSTPEEAFEMWSQLSSVTGWRMEFDLYHPNLKRQWFRQQSNDEQLSIGTHRHEDIKPFSSLRYIKTSYSNSSVPVSKDRCEWLINI